MFSREYRFKFYLNAKHSTKIGNKDSKIHPHTWEIVLLVRKTNEGFFQFTEIENDIKNYLEKYEGGYLNAITPFDTLNPFMENIGDVVWENVSKLLSGKGWLLQRLEISENPTRTYIISIEDYNNAGQAYKSDKSDETQDGIKDDLKNEIVINEALAVHGTISAVPGNEPGEISMTLEDAVAMSALTQIAAAEDKSELIVSGTFLDKLEHPSNENITIHPAQTAVETETEEGNLPVEGNIPVYSETFLPSGKGEKRKLKTVLWSLIIILIAAAIMVLYVTRDGYYPWGTDIWGHLFKANYLFTQITAGNILPQYTDLWFEGTSPFGGGAILPYYAIALIEFATGGDLILSYNLFLGLLFIIGATGWVVWGLKVGRSKFALVLGILWFFMPYNLRMLFFEGDILKAMAVSLFPILTAYAWDFIEKKNKKALIGLTISFFMMFLCHITVSIIAGVVVLLYALLYSKKSDKLRGTFEIFSSFAFSIFIAGIWIYPYLKNFFTTPKDISVLDASQYNLHPVLELLNPLSLLRGDTHVIYFGVSIVAISLLGLFFSSRKSRTGFIITLLGLVCTTTLLLPIITKLFSGYAIQVWDSIPFAIGTFFSGLLLWDKLKKQILLVVVLFLILEAAVSFKALGFHEQEPFVKDELNPAISIATQKVAVFGIDSFGSFPSYYITYNKKGRELKQLFGWDWKNSKLSPNIVWLNTALDKGWYPFLFDRCLEMGADTLVFHKNKIPDMEEFLKFAKAAGYEKKIETKLGIVLKYPVDSSFGTKVSYKGFGIGKYASNIAYMLPQIEIGDSYYLDDYPLDTLKGYSVLYLSGFKFRDKAKAENMVKELSSKGVKVVIDLTNTESDILTSKANFLGVMAEPAEFFGHFPVLHIGGKSVELGEIPKEYSDWRTIYIENLDQVYGKTEFKSQEMNFLGTKQNDNIIFTGFNLPFFASETKDEKALEILKNVTGLELNQTPHREVVKTDISYNRDEIYIKAAKSDTVTGVARLDNLEQIAGSSKTVHNLILVEGKEVIFKVVYPYLIQGTVLSAVGFVGFIFFYLLQGRKRDKITDFNVSALDVRMG